MLYNSSGPSEWNVMTGTEMEGELVLFKTHFQTILRFLTHSINFTKIDSNKYPCIYPN